MGIYCTVFPPFLWNRVASLCLFSLGQGQVSRLSVRDLQEKCLGTSWDLLPRRNTYDIYLDYGFFIIIKGNLNQWHTPILESRVTVKLPLSGTACAVPYLQVVMIDLGLLEFFQRCLCCLMLGFFLRIPNSFPRNVSHSAPHNKSPIVRQSRFRHCLEPGPQTHLHAQLCQGAHRCLLFRCKRVYRPGQLRTIDLRRRSWYGLLWWYSCHQLNQCSRAFTESGWNISEWIIPLYSETAALLETLYQLCVNPFTPESDQCQISPPAPPEILHHTVRRAWFFIAYSDEKWL